MLVFDILAFSQRCKKGLRIRRGHAGGGPGQFKTEKRSGREVPRVILIALVLAAIYFTDREILMRLILTLPQ